MIPITARSQETQNYNNSLFLPDHNLYILNVSESSSVFFFYLSIVIKPLTCLKISHNNYGSMYSEDWKVWVWPVAYVLCSAGYYKVLQWFEKYKHSCSTWETKGPSLKCISLHSFPGHNTQGYVGRWRKGRIYWRQAVLGNWLVNFFSQFKGALQENKMYLLKGQAQQGSF